MQRPHQAVRPAWSIVARRSAPKTASYAACQERVCTSPIASASSGRACRTSMPLLAGVFRDELRDGGDLSVGQLALEGRHRATADLDLVLDNGLRRLQLIEIRA